jgi:glycosyltransferase involved in cell wall biosynthesis
LRLAVFTNEFPARVCTFFARDIRGLLEAGIDIDIFPIYPLEPDLWRYVPHVLGERALPKSKIHHLSLLQALRSAKLWPFGKLSTFLRDTVAVSSSAAGFGVEQLAKSMYVLLKALVWARQYRGDYDHILAYWGNYAATSAYVYHRLAHQGIPFSLFLHAKIDLYSNQIFLEKKLLYADNVIVVCEFNREFIRKRYPHLFHKISNKIHVHHLGLDLSEFSYEPDNRSLKKVLAVGRFERQKGFDYLLHATHELRQRGVDIEVELVGDGKEANALKALANTLQLWGRVRFRGWLHPDEVRMAMRQATVLVHPSSGLGDAVPTVIKESMAIGTPVIASEVAGIPELLDSGRCGVLVPPKNAKALATEIEKLIANDALRRKYAYAARRYAERKFDLWRNGRGLADILRSTTRPKIAVG